MNKYLDFTYRKFSELLDKFREKGYSFRKMEDTINDFPVKSVIRYHGHVSSHPQVAWSCHENSANGW